MSILGQTLQLALRIALVWAGGMALAVLVRALLPESAGFHLVARQSSIFIPFNRVGFWTCLLAALTVSALVVLRAMLADFGVSGIK